MKKLRRDEYGRCDLRRLVQKVYVIFLERKKAIGPYRLPRRNGVRGGWKAFFADARGGDDPWRREAA